MKKILLIDSLTTSIDREKTLLDRADLNVFTATTSEEALRLHRKEKMDLIVTDIDMPGISGDKLCSLLRSESDLKKVSVVLVCGNTRADVQRVEACGANAYVTKPLRPVDFIEKVSRLLDIPERKSYRVILKVRVNGTDKKESFFCTSRDISSTGLLIETDKTLTKGNNICLSFFLPGSDRVETDAEVVRVVNSDSGNQYGVRYIDIGIRSRSAIEQFIKKRARSG